MYFLTFLFFFLFKNINVWTKCSYEQTMQNILSRSQSLEIINMKKIYIYLLLWLLENSGLKLFIFIKSRIIVTDKNENYFLLPVLS